MTTKNDEIDDGLTEEEREALNEDEGSGVTAEASAADEEADDGETGEAGEAEVGVGANDSGAGDTAAADTGAAAEEPAESVHESTPILVAPPPENIEARLAEIADQKEALLTQFDDGDITMREYQKALEDVTKQERAIERAQDRAELASQMETQRLQNDWTATCNAFVEENAIYKNNPRLYKALDAEVRELAQRPDTANWTGQRFLDTAHKNLAEAFGLPQSKPAKAAETARKARDLPPNLANVPAAMVEDTSGNRFAVLDRMAQSDPMAYEETLNKMPTAEREAYLAAG